MRNAVLLLLFCLPILGADAVGPALRQAHAHNDYEHARPLMDALAQGFTSVEADIHLVNGELLVAHDAEDVNAKKTLDALYLNSLRRLAGDRRSVFASGETLTLLIDIKTEAEATYVALNQVLKKYDSILTKFEGEHIRTNAVTIVLSGNRPRQTLLREHSRYAAFDGRISDLGQRLSPAFMPLVSDNWNNHFNWKGIGEFSEMEREKLKRLVETAHGEKRRIRFWATPDTEVVWRELQQAGVDLINTDDLAGLAKFLRSREKNAD